MDGWIEGGARRLPGTVAADAAVLLNLMYPSTWAIAEHVLLPVWAAALPATVASLAHEDDDLALHELGLGKEAVLEGREWWRAFHREVDGYCAWTYGVAPLLALLVGHNGNHADPREAFVPTARAALEDATRAAWLVHAREGEDGQWTPPPPCPAAGLAAHDRVRRPHIDPLIVGDVERGVEPRGALVGLKPFQLRQVCTLALGAAVEGVRVQVARNEGVPRCASRARPTSSTATASRARPSPSRPCRRKVRPPPAAPPGPGRPSRAAHARRARRAADEAAWGTREQAAQLQAAARRLGPQHQAALARLPRHPLAAAARARIERGIQGAATAAQQKTIDDKINSQKTSAALQDAIDTMVAARAAPLGKA